MPFEAVQHRFYHTGATRCVGPLNRKHRLAGTGVLSHLITQVVSTSASSRLPKADIPRAWNDQIFGPDLRPWKGSWYFWDQFGDQYQ